MNELNKAVAEVMAFIAQGVIFPMAVRRVSKRSNVDYEELKAECLRRSVAARKKRTIIYKDWIN